MGPIKRGKDDINGIRTNQSRVDILSKRLEKCN
jgi:hypothetical protein